MCVCLSFSRLKSLISESLFPYLTCCLLYWRFFLRSKLVAGLYEINISSPVKLQSQTLFTRSWHMYLFLYLVLFVDSRKETMRGEGTCPYSDKLLTFTCLGNHHCRRPRCWTKPITKSKEITWKTPYFCRFTFR